MSDAAISTARITERLSAFKEKIEQTQPIDNFFQRHVTLDALMKNKKMINGGRQEGHPINLGDNSTVKWFKDYDTFDTTPQDTARTVVYPFKNMGGTVTISWEEIRETNGSDNQIFDLVKHRRDTLNETMMAALNSHLYTASAASDEILTLPQIISATGSIGGIDASTEPKWASVVEAAVGSFATNGVTKMNSLFNQLLINKAKVDTLITTREIYEAYEAECLGDVQYVDLAKGDRSFKAISFKGLPLQFDHDCTSGAIYMFDSSALMFKIDSDANFKIDDFIRPYNQKAFTATASFRGQLITTQRRALGKATGITLP